MRRVRLVAAAILLLAFPCTTFAGETGAMVFPSGEVRVNEGSVSLPTAVFDGDKIRTSDGTASLSMTGTVLQVMPKSSLIFAKNEIALDSGSVKVATTSGVVGRVLNLGIQPASSGTSRYEMSRGGGKIVIAALEGKLRLTDGRSEMLVSAGQAVSVPASDQEQQLKCPIGKHQEIKDGVWQCVADKGAGAVINTPAGAGATLSHATVALITAGTLGGATALGFGLASALSGPPASPVK